ncbi:hypothetical protein [Streptomyces sp. N2A]|uniref:hypothetical protein n=1 Tax=Streptomyces sp. N2A TaxID=3073936 RepID=UPI00286FE175|nr:hypothetical protein [Streptomyces sp. N2A]
MDDWVSVVHELAGDPLVQLATKVGVRAVVRRVRRGGPGAAAHSEAGPALASTKGTENPVTMVTEDSTTGGQLAESLLQGVGNEGMRAATRLLGAHRGGYWLHRLLEQEAQLSATARKPVIDRSGRHPSVDWDVIGLLLLDSPHVFKSSSSELAVLKVAASLVSRCGVQLGTVVQVVDDRELRLILRAIGEAAYGEGG